ncbi:RNA methyltransferase tRNA(m5U54)methyltransferase [Cystobasidiomycetes sp. EMM_F5]
MDEQSFPPAPAGYRVHVEGRAGILVPDGSSTSIPDKDKHQNVFVNPIQEFNRDVSIAAIRAWSEMVDAVKREQWEQKQAARKSRPDSEHASSKPSKKRRLEQDPSGSVSTAESASQDSLADTVIADDNEPSSKRSADTAPVFSSTSAYRSHKFTLFEGLSATGLRSIRYAKEIPLLKWVQANDLSSAAADNIALNVEFNGLGGSATRDAVSHKSSGASTSANTEDIASSTDKAPIQSANGKGKQRISPSTDSKVRVSRGDCMAVLYSHRSEKERFDVVDLDPYGTAAPFIDGAVQAVTDGGLLCVTCTDLAVLAGTNYPEKCFSNYGGLPVKAEFTHEVALRLVLHTIATSAARYGRYIEPLLSLSIDYYLRVFVRIQTRPEQVKRLASQTGHVFVCHGCKATYVQPLGRITEKINQSTGKSHTNYGLAAGPPVGQHCDHCGGTLHLGGPMWIGKLHDEAYVDRILQHVDSDEDAYGTSTRMRGMLTLARNELTDLFYYNPSKTASLFHATCPPLLTVASALLNAGHAVSRSHAQPGTIKTSAPTSFVYDIIREWIKANPIKMGNVKDGSPAKALLDRSQTHEVDLSHHPDVEKKMLMNIKIVKYQTNPTANWGPQSKAKASKSKGSDNQEQNPKIQAEAAQMRDDDEA